MIQIIIIIYIDIQIIVIYYYVLLSVGKFIIFPI